MGAIMISGYIFFSSWFYGSQAINSPEPGAPFKRSLSESFGGTNEKPHSRPNDGLEWGTHFSLARGFCPALPFLLTPSAALRLRSRLRGGAVPAHARLLRTPA